MLLGARPIPCKTSRGVSEGVRITPVGISAGTMRGRRGQEGPLLQKVVDGRSLESGLKVASPRLRRSPQGIICRIFLRPHGTKSSHVCVPV